MKNKKSLIIYFLIIIVIVLIVIFVLNKNSLVTNNQVSTVSINDRCIGIVKNIESNGLYTYNTELKSTSFEYAGEVDNKYLVETDKYDVYIDETDFTISNISYDRAGSIEKDTLKDFMNTLAFMTAKDKYISNLYDEKYNLKNYVYGNPLTDVSYDNNEIVNLKIYESADNYSTAIGKLLGEFKVNFKTEEVTFTAAK